MRRVRAAQPKMPLTSAISARNAISMAAMFRHRCRPSPAPCAAASMTLTAVFSSFTSTLPAVTGVSDFRLEDLRQHDGGGRGHDDRGEQMLNLDVREQNIRRHHRAGHVRHAADHDGEQFGLRQPGEKRPDGQRRFRLPHEDAGRDIQRFRAACAHDLLHPDRNAFTIHCMIAEIVEDREERRDEDDDRQNLEGENGRPDEPPESQFARACRRRRTALPSSA